MGFKEWVIVIGVIVGVTALLLLAARWRKRRYDDIYGQDSPDSDQPEVEYTSELPSGGARTVGYRDVNDIEKTNQEIRQRADSLKPRLSSYAPAPREQRALFEEPEEVDAADAEDAENAEEEQIPLLLDPSEEHSESEGFSKSKRPSPETATNKPPENSVPNNPQTENPESTDSEDDDEPDSETELAAASEQAAEELEEVARSLAESEDLDTPEDLDTSVGVGGKEQQPVSKADTKAVTDKASSKSGKEDKKTSKKQAAAQEQKQPSDPPEVIIINLMTSPETPYEGQPLLRALTELGMRFGDMDIFHYCGKHGDEAPQFRMANLLNPGVFDMDKMSELRTHALCFFFELEADQNNMAVYESMISVISRLKDELGGEMRDDQRSVFTIQTSEHCRNRIRDFQRRHLVKKG